MRGAGMKSAGMFLLAYAIALCGEDTTAAKPYTREPRTQPAPTQRWRGSQGWGHKSQYFALYDPEAIDTITGAVEAVDRQTPLSDMYYGVFLIVDSPREDFDITVHLGPGWYIDNQDTRVQAGDTVTVYGSRIMLEGEPTIIASKILLGGKTLVLREKNGLPVWVGWRDR
jgi:hypothetical protein